MTASEAENGARCLEPYGAEINDAIITDLERQWAMSSETASELANAAKCFLSCTTAEERSAIQTMLLARLAGASSDPSALANEARCFGSCIPPGGQRAVQAFLLSEILENS